VEEYAQKKAAGDFEVQRPKTTKEIAVHNNQLLQGLPGQMMQVMLQAQQAKQPAGYCEALHEPPAAPRPTAEEQEALAEAQRQELMQRVTELEAGRAGELLVCNLWAAAELASLSEPVA
jgi:Zn-dependent oligopeptidase